MASKDDWHVRIPKFRMTRMDELEGAPARRLSFHPEVVTYLAPEQHKKLMITQKTDQYSLALLAIEMLQGEPPVLVKTLSDIKRAVAAAAQGALQDALEGSQGPLCLHAGDRR